MLKLKNEFSYFARSPKGQVPWITLNGVEVSDSQFSIEYLAKYFGKDLSDHLNLVEKSISRGFLKLAETSLHWYGLSSPVFYILTVSFNKK